METARIGKRRVGRPAARWSYDLRKAAGGKGMRKAEDRAIWGSLGEAYADNDDDVFVFSWTENHSVFRFETIL